MPFASFYMFRGLYKSILLYLKGQTKKQQTTVKQGFLYINIQKDI